MIVHTSTPQSPIRAACFMTLASLLIATSSVFAKIAGTGDAPLHPLQISHARFMFAFLSLCVFLALVRPRFGKIHIKLHIARTVLGWLGISLTFYAITLISLPDAISISFLNPVFAMILAAFFLKETVGSWRWGGAIIALLGGFVLLRPQFGAEQGVIQTGAFVALAAAFFIGIEVIIIKQLSNVEKTLQILTINNALGVMIATIAVMFVWQWPTPSQWPILVCVGVAMVCAQTCFIQAMKSAEASAILALQYFALIFAAIYDWLVFEILPDHISFIGAGIIITGAGVITWREALKRPCQTKTINTTQGGAGTGE